MSEPVVVVGGWASPFVTRVCIALKLKGVDYEFVQEAVGRKSELLLRSNPVYKKMPVLLHGGRPVCESIVILHYVDEAFPGPSVLPADPYRRAVHRFWAEYADAKVSQPAPDTRDHLKFSLLSRLITALSIPGGRSSTRRFGR
jgi:glutathione S-transferase